MVVYVNTRNLHYVPSQVISTTIFHNLYNTFYSFSQVDQDGEEQAETSLNSLLHAEVIYTFQFSNAEIACNQSCHSEGQSWQAW